MLLSEAQKIYSGSRTVDAVYKGSSLVWGGELPTGYKKCLYLQSTGTQCIDTGYTYSDFTDVIDLILTPLESGVDKCFFGSYTSKPCELAQLSTYFRANVADSLSNAPSLSKDTKYEMTLSSRFWKYNGSSFGSMAYVQSHTEYLFARYYNGISKASVCKIHGLKITRDDDVLLNLIPALDKSGTPCMYDTVSKTPLYNIGTGDFLYELA